MKNQLQPIGSQWCGVDKTEDNSEHSMVISALKCRLTLTQGHRCDTQLFDFLSSMSSGYHSTLNLEDLLAHCRSAFPAKGVPAQTNLCLCHVTRKRIITIAQRQKMRRDRPASYLVLQGPPPLGQKLYIYPTVPLICCLQTSRQQLYNSQLLNVLSYDEQYIYVQDPESEQTHTLTHEFVKTSCRSAHAYTIASCQGRQYTGTIALWDTKHAKYSKRHAYTALSRSRSYAALSIED